MGITRQDVRAMDVPAACRGPEDITMQYSELRTDNKYSFKTLLLSCIIHQISLRSFQLQYLSISLSDLKQYID
jgi:hypothetical protein